MVTTECSASLRLSRPPLGIQDQWYAYKNDALKKIARNRCEEHNIEYVDTVRRKG